MSIDILSLSHNILFRELRDRSFCFSIEKCHELGTIVMDDWESAYPRFMVAWRHGLADTDRQTKSTNLLRDDLWWLRCKLGRIHFYDWVVDVFMIAFRLVIRHVKSLLSDYRECFWKFLIKMVVEYGREVGSPPESHQVAPDRWLEDQENTNKNAEAEDHFQEI